MTKGFPFFLALKMQPALISGSIKKFGSGSTLKVAAPAPQHCSQPEYENENSEYVWFVG